MLKNPYFVSMKITVGSRKITCLNKEQNVYPTKPIKNGTK